MTYPPTVETSPTWILEHGIGWDAIAMMTDQAPAVEYDDARRPVGLRFALGDKWWIIVVATPTGWSIGRGRAMITFGWVHGIDSADLADRAQRAAAVGFPWPPTEEDP